MQWQFTQNCYVESATLHWTKVFGSYNEKTHFKKLFDGNDSFNLIMTHDKFKKLLLINLKMNIDEYQKFWKEVMQARNNRFAHNDYEYPVSILMFDVDILQEVCISFFKTFSNIFYTNNLSLYYSNDSKRLIELFCSYNKVLDRFQHVEFNLSKA